MNISSYLCIKKTGSKYAPRYSVRVTKTSPALDFNEIAMKLSLQIPDEIFEKPQLSASITVPKEAVSAPVIEAEIIDNVEQIIEQQTGFKVKLEVVSKDEEQ